jgi:deazaflavin-dependent oxidoreductase (nitroreductase family)
MNEDSRMDLQNLNISVIEEFRANNGKVTGNFDGMPLLLINTIGAKSGKQYTKPLAYLADGERFVVIASYAGHEHNPPWYHNLLAHPDIDIEVGDQVISVLASVANEPERSVLFDKMASVMPVFNDYQSKTTRRIPVVTFART